MPPAGLKLKTASSRGAFELEVEFEVITPVFGGGVHLGSDERKRHLKTIDPVTSVRGAAVRGQLRFWWRAVEGSRAGAYSDVRRMRDRERELWGLGSHPGALSLEVLAPRVAIEPVHVFRIESYTKKNGQPGHRIKPLDGMSSIAYGAFSLQPRAKDLATQQPGVLHRLDGTIRLRLTGPLGMEESARRAVDAWLLFGGIGGRTRRGFGAIAPTIAGVGPEKFIAQFKDADSLHGVPSLFGATYAIGKTTNQALDSQSSALGSLQTFRQGKNVGRNPPQPTPGNKKPVGRSRWPEAESIRVLTNNPQNSHSDRFVKVDRFPRAAFGMPIIFHFQQDEPEPADTTLRPASFERLASPLILRPFRDGPRFRPLALRLSNPAADALPLELRDSESGSCISPVEASLSQLTDKEIQRIRPLNGERDVLARFLSFFREHC